MRWLLFSLVCSGISAQIKYDTIIEKGIFKSYFNYSIKESVAVTYTLYHGGGKASRKNDKFIYEASIPTLDSKDYLHSGYDRGHLAPAEDFAYSDSLQNITFRYYNCVPQNPKLNRGKWKKYESKARKLSQEDTVIIICYNRFIGVKKGSMTIPTECYKGVYSYRSKELLFVVGFENTEEAKEVIITNDIYEVLNNLLLMF